MCVIEETTRLSLVVMMIFSGPPKAEYVKFQ